jgi:hypothetical protein
VGWGRAVVPRGGASAGRCVPVQLCPVHTGWLVQCSAAHRAPASPTDWVTGPTEEEAIAALRLSWSRQARSECPLLPATLHKGVLCCVRYAQPWLPACAGLFWARGRLGR